MRQAGAEALGQTGTSNEVASERHQIRVVCRENRLGAVPGGAAGHDEGAAEPWAQMLSRDRRLALDDKLGAVGSGPRRGGRRPEAHTTEPQSQIHTLSSGICMKK